MRDIFKVYLIREKSTRAIKYAGLTRQTLEKRFRQHYDRRKFRFQDYFIELVQDNLTIDQAVTLEKMLIAQYDLIKTGWNESPGSINGHSNYHSEEQKQKWSEERKGRKLRPEHAYKFGHGRVGKKNTPEHLAAILQGTQKAVICLETGKVFPSARRAAEEMGLHFAKISLVCNGKRRTTGGFHFRFVNETAEVGRNAQPQTKESE